jgi:beta-N-acetylhexosaminidase
MLLGCNLNFAPVLDIDHHPGANNALSGRCWGADSQAVINRAGVWNRWQKKRGMRTCGKHFPAGGRALADPHHDLPVAQVDFATLLREDILPYTALMPELDAVMIAHVHYPLLDPQWPASLSRRIVTDFLRYQLGFDRHLVITDDLDMGAIRQHYGRGEDVKQSIRAGNDLAMICHQLDSLPLAVQALQELSEAEVDDSLQRVARFRKRLPRPLPWSEQRWQQTCAEIEALSQSFLPVETEDGTAVSPVTQY